MKYNTIILCVYSAKKEYTCSDTYIIESSLLLIQPLYGNSSFVVITAELITQSRKCGYGVKYIYYAVFFFVFFFLFLTKFEKKIFPLYVSFIL